MIKNITVNKPSKGRNPDFKCIICGKYVSYKDIDSGKIKSKFTPDTEFTNERMEFWHKYHDEKVSNCRGQVG